MKRRGVKPKDHVRQNIGHLRELQKENEKRRAELEKAENDSKQLFKLKEFQNVEAVVMKEVQAVRTHTVILFV